MKLSKAFVIGFCIWLLIGFTNWLFWDSDTKKEEGFWGFISALLRGAVMYFL